MSKSKQLPVYYVYLNFDKNETEILSPEGEFSVIKGGYFIDYLPKDDDVVCFCSNLKAVEKLYPYGRKTGLRDWKHFNKAEDIRDYYYKNIHFRSIGPFMVGRNVKNLRDLEINNENTPLVCCIANYLRSISNDNPQKLRYSIAHEAKKRFFNSIEQKLLWEEIKENHHLYHDFMSYVDAGTCCKAGHTSFMLKNERHKNVLMYDKRSAHGGAIMYDYMAPVGKMCRVSEEYHDKFEIICLIKRYIKEKIPFKIIFCSAELPEINRFFITYDERRCETGIDHYDVVSIIRLGLWETLVKYIKSNEIRLYYWRPDKNGEYKYSKKIKKPLAEKYKLKEQKESGSMDRFFAKSEISMLYGKGIQNTDEDIHDINAVKKRFRGRGDNYLTPELSNNLASRVKFELIKAICECEAVYWDTDGIKVPYTAHNIEYFRKENKKIMKWNAEAGFPDCNIGTWKFEGIAQDFINISVKNYCYLKDGKVTMTTSSVDKETRAEIIEAYKDNPEELMDIIWYEGFDVRKVGYYIEDGNLLKGLTEPFIFGCNNERSDINAKKSQT